MKSERSELSKDGSRTSDWNGLIRREVIKKQWLGLVDRLLHNVQSLEDSGRLGGTRGMKRVIAQKPNKSRREISTGGEEFTVAVASYIDRA